MQRSNADNEKHIERGNRECAFVFHDGDSTLWIEMLSMIVEC